MMSREFHLTQLMIMTHMSWRNRGGDREGPSPPDPIDVHFLEWNPGDPRGNWALFSINENGPFLLESWTVESAGLSIVVVRVEFWAI